MWGLLAVITSQKISEQRRFLNQLKRGGSIVSGESGFAQFGDAGICGHTEESAKERYWQVSDSDLDLAIKKLGNLPSVSIGVSINSGKECPTVSQADSKQEGSDLSQVSIETQFIAICRLLSEVAFGNGSASVMEWAIQNSNL